jgi:hypothetical protein
MSTTLASALGQEFQSAQDYRVFFKGKDLAAVDGYVLRESSRIGVPAESCNTNLFFGFFFDGTRNNYLKSESTKDHSNVARLYDCYPGLGVPGVLPPETDCQPETHPHFFKVYVPGVASPFPQIGDSGEGFEGTTGGAGGRLGERRIVWALAQAINNLHRYFLKTPLITGPNMERLFKYVSLTREAREVMDPSKAAHVHQRVRYAVGGPREEFQKALARLHSATAPHRPNPKTGRPQKVNPGVVKSIYVSIFGFSRGASEARVFANWLLSLCKLDAELLGQTGGMSLAGFRVEFNFLGIFDTVASVGMANSARLWDGHAAWADADDSLRVPAAMKRCLHLVAAHELRRSFPVDSISVNGTLPAGCEEVVVPGVHSDIGGGYCPVEQGKGRDRNGDDMLSRIPLLMMYKSARVNGVPLKLELAADSAKRRFAVSPKTIEAFNAYVLTCKETSGPLHQIMREQERKQMEWRLARRVSGVTPLHKTPAFARASTLQQNDLYSAALEFEEEIKLFQGWLQNKGPRFRAAFQPAGFRDDRDAEWEEIATWWNNRAQIAPEVLQFFDNYVHDSRAAFKCFGDPDNEKDMHALLQQWVKQRNRERSLLGSPYYASAGVSLGQDQALAADEYAKTGKIPRMLNSGRESLVLSQAGYLRYRRVYAGSNSWLVS